MLCISLHNLGFFSTLKDWALKCMYLAACVFIEEAEWSWSTVRGVKHSQGKVDWLLHNSGWSSSPQSTHPKFEPFSKCVGEPGTWWGISNATPWHCVLAHKEGTGQECTSSKNHRAGQDCLAPICWKGKFVKCCSLPPSTVSVFKNF